MSTDTSKKKTRFGLVGTIIGFITLAIAIIHYSLNVGENSKSAEPTISEKVLQLKERIKAKISGDDYRVQNTPDEFNRNAYFAIVVSGILSIGFGVIGFLKKEDIRESGMAIALGLAAIAIKFAVTVVGMALGIVFVLVFLSGFVVS